MLSYRWLTLPHTILSRFEIVISIHKVHRGIVKQNTCSVLQSDFYSNMGFRNFLALNVLELKLHLVRFTAHSDWDWER